MTFKYSLKRYSGVFSLRTQFPFDFLCPILWDKRMAPQMHILASRTVRALTGSQSNQHFQSLAFFSLLQFQKYSRNIPKVFPFLKGFHFSGSLLGGIFSPFLSFSHENILKGGGQSHSSWIQQKSSVFSNEKLLRRLWKIIIFLGKKGVQKRKWVKMKVCFKISWQLTRSKVNDGLSRPKVLGLTL